MNEYINTSEAKNILKVTPTTLRTWAKKNKIRTIRTPSNQRLYNKEDVFNIAGIPITIQKKQKIVYCRVSSKKQMDDLERQKTFLQSKFPSHVLVTDIGSGINWKRKGLNTILEQTMSGTIEEVVVAHGDRLCRFAFDLLEYIFALNKVKLVVLQESTHMSKEEELATDLLSIVHIYTCRNMGRRRYKNKDHTNLPVDATEDSSQEMDGDDQVCI